MSANGKKRDKSFIALLVLIIVCACLMVAAITTLGIGMSNGDLSDDQQSEQTGNRGTVWHKGKGVPGNDVGVEGDYYLDEATGDVYCKSATGWGNVVLNLKGTDGITPEIKGGYWWIGDKNTGVRAEAVLAPEIKPDGYWYFDGVKSDYKAFPTMTSGTEAPDNKNGALGDFYVQKAADGTVTFYQKVKDASTGNIEWKSVVTVEPSVATDVNGAKWFVGTTAPTADNPAGAKVGDFYLDTSKNNIYLMTASGWGSPIGNLHDAPVTQPDTVLYGTVAPDAVTEDGNPELYQALRDAKIGDYYFNNATGEVYQKVANNGDKDDWKDAGFSIKGEDGNKWYHGSGEPTAENPALKDVVPNAGDIYFDEDAHLLYTYGAEGWGKGVPFGTPGGQAQQWHHGTGEPTAVKDSNNGDFYIDQTSGELYQRNDAADGSEHWDDLGIKIQGTAGTPGNKWYHGTLAPTDENNGALKDVVLNEGDIYYDTDDHLLFTYGKDGWDSGISFGAQGTPGTHWYHGESKPSAEDPAGAQNGDYYFDSSSNIIYIKEAGDWTELVDLTPAAPAEPDIRDGIWWIGDRNTGIPATGEKGEDGKTPYIGEGNHWYIDGNDLGPAVGEKGEPGDTPFINDDGYWQIGENVTEFKAEGVDGKNGTVWHSGEGKPVMEDNKIAGEFYTYNVNEGDFYLDVKTGKVYVLESDLESEGTLAWREIATLRDTLQNVHGAWYLNGRPTGLYVSTWYTGEGDPNDAAEPLMGNYGDLYLDTLTGDVYVSDAALGEESEAWTYKLNIKGERGNYLYSGKGVPVLNPEEDNQPEKFYVAGAKPGDMYLDTNTGDIYQMQADGTWGDSIFTTKGDKGDRGSKWFHGTEAPKLIEDAVVGDYYFETKHGYIYTLTEVTKDAEENVIGQTWALVNEDDPLAGTKWLSGDVDPDKADGDLKTLLDGANDWDVYFNTTDKTIWQLTPTGPGTSEWQLLGHLTNETDRGTVWYYGTYDPTVENDQDGFAKATEGHIFGDFYLQTYYPFSGYTGFRIYIFEDDGHLGAWNMHVDMRSEVKGEFKYEIPNYDALRAFRDSVNGAFEGKQANSYKDSNTGKQTTVTLTGQVTIPEDEKFGMIGEEDTTPFSGIFDGGTEGLFIEGQGLEGPLFGYLDGAEIKNLHVKAKLDELTLATFALGDKTSLLTNTYGIAKSAKDTKFEKVTLELSNADGTVVVVWDEVGNVSVTVKGNKPASTAEGHRMRATGSADDYLLVLRGRKLELGKADFTFEHVKFEDTYVDSSYIDVTNAKSLTLIGCYANVNPVEACERDENGNPVMVKENLPLSGAYAKERTGNAAFIVSRSNSEREAALELTIKDSTILAARSAANTDAILNTGKQDPDPYSMAVLINVDVSKATVTGNIFGANSDGERYLGSVVEFKSMADGAELTISDNEVYGADGATAFALSDATVTETETKAYTAIFGDNTVDASNGTFLAVTGKGHAQVYLLGELADDNYVNSNTIGSGETYSTNLYRAVKTESDESFDFIAFAADKVETEGHLFEMFRGKVYLGSNFGAEHEQFKPADLEKKVTPEGVTSKEFEYGHDIWIIDLAFEDPEGFVQHIADYTDHYYVNNAAGLGSFRDMVNGIGSYAEKTPNSFNGKTIVTTKDINLAGINWIPIGTWNAGTAFSGTFTTTYQEHRYAIKNLTIDRTIVEDGKKDLSSYGSDADMTYWTLGLFGYVTHGDAKNAKLEGIHIENVTIKANPSATNSFGMGMSYYPAIGALVGHTYQLDGAIKDILVDGGINIQSENYIRVGGVVGMTYSHLENVTLKANEGGKIASNGRGIPGTFIGGIVGHTGGTTVLTGLHASNLTISGYRNLGGLAGVMTGNGSTTVSDSTVTNIHIIQQAFTGDTYDNGTTNLYAKNVGAVAGSLGDVTTSITVKGITATDVILERPANSAAKYNEKYYTKAVFHDGYVGGAYKSHESGTVNIENSTLRAKLDEGLYINNGVYEIENATGLQRFADMVSKTQSFYSAKFDSRPDTTGMQVKLLSNINIADLKDAEGNWFTSQDESEYKYVYALIPIGTDTISSDYYGANTFKGTFDGQTHSITGLTSALFAETDGATVKNLVLDGVAIDSTTANVGGLINEATGTTLDKITVIGSVSGTYNVGGLIGEAHGATTISNALVKATVTKTDMADAAHARSIGVLVGAAEGTVTLSDVYTSEFYQVPVTVIDNQYTDGNLNYLVYNYGLVGSALSGVATDEWATDKGVLPAAAIEFDDTIAPPRSTGSINARITATDLYLTATYAKDGTASVYVNVQSAQGLASVAELVNHGITFEGEDVVLGSNISMAGYAENGVSKWVGIGNAGHAFEGTFNGLNNEIDHLYGPLFGNLAGTVQNLTLGDLNINKLAGDTAATKGTVAKAVSGSAKIENVTVIAWVQGVNKVGAVNPSDVAAAPFGLYEEGSATVVSSEITITFKAQNIVFNAKIDGKSNSIVTYTGDTVTDAVATHKYVAVVNDEIFRLGGFNTNVNVNTPTTSVTFKGIKFTGNSYIDMNWGDVGSVPAITEFTMTDCYADVSPATVSGMFPAFILGRSERNGKFAMKFTFTNNYVLSNKGSTTTQYEDGAQAIHMWVPFADGSVISGNVFGSAEKPYHEAIIDVHGFGTYGGTTTDFIKFEDNTFYADGSKSYSAGRWPGYNGGAIVLTPNSTGNHPYTVLVDGNTLYINNGNTADANAYSLVNVGGTNDSCARVIITKDNHVVTNGEENTIDFNLVSRALRYKKFDFVAYNAVLNDEGKITSGDLIFGYDSRFESTKDVEMVSLLTDETNGYVAEGSEANVHVVIGEQFGRRLSDLLAGEYNTYYNFSLVGLNSFASLVNVAGWTGEGKTVKLADELSGSHVLDLSSYTSWTPIGNAEHPFKGTFDGSYTDTNGKAANWTIKKLTYTGTDDLVGFFGHTEGGELKNLVILDVNVNISATSSTTRNTGALVALAVRTNISNIEVQTANLNGYIGDAGAVAGHVEGGTVSDITVTNLTIATTSTPTVGAVVGVAKNNCTLEGIKVCVANGEGDVLISDGNVKVTGASKVGGVVGVAEDGVTIGTAKKPVYSGAILTASSVTESTTFQIGGIVGALTVSASAASSNFTVTNAHFVGSLSRVGWTNASSTKYENYGLVGGYTTTTKGTVEITSSSLDVIHFEAKENAKDQFVQDTDWGSDAASKENVTSEYQITGIEAFKFFRDQVNGGNTYAEEIDNKTIIRETVHLMADIDLDNKEWTPIGYDEKVGVNKPAPEYVFRGIFTAHKEEAGKTVDIMVTGADGAQHDSGYDLNPNAYTISNLQVLGHNDHTLAEADVDGNSMGLFGRTDRAIIKDLNIKNAKVTGNFGVAVVVGTGKATAFENVTVANAVVKGHSYVGGIAGHNDCSEGLWDIGVEGYVNVQVVGLQAQAFPEKLMNGENPIFDYGAKLGGLVGFSKGAVFTNSTVAEATLTAYKDLGGLAGIDNGDPIDARNNTVKNVDLVIKRSGYTKEYADPDGMSGYAVEYAHTDAADDQNVNWMVGRLKSGVTAEMAAAHGINVEGGEFNNHKIDVTTTLGDTESAKGLVYDNNAWHIVTPQGLQTFKDVDDGSGAGTTWNGTSVNKGFNGTTVYLECDVDLNDFVESSTASSPRARAARSAETPNWQPIGGGKSDSDGFMGTFDGQGHSIKNMYVTGPNFKGGHVGFFGYINTTATVRNLVFENPTVKVENAPDKCYVGVLAGRIGMDSGCANISNITIKGDVVVEATGTQVAAGGLAGVIGPANISDITIEATSGHVKSNMDVGGLAGIVGYGEPNFDGIDVTIDVETTSEDVLTGVGGLIGAYNLSGKLSVTNSNFHGDVTSAAAGFKAVEHAFIGKNASNENVTIKDSSSTVTNAEAQEPKDFFYGAVADSKGKITEGYIIESANGLKEFASLVNGGNTFADKTIFLVADIDLKEIGTWTPIGGANNRFMGTFDGLGHSISNIHVSGSKYVGLFGVVGDIDKPDITPAIKNLVIGGNNQIIINAADAKYRNDSGILVGYAAKTTFENIEVLGDVNLYAYFGDPSAQFLYGCTVGGLVGASQSNTYNNIIFTPTRGYVGADAGWTVGGVIGLSMNDTITTMTVKNVTVRGGAAVGGVIGANYNGLTMTGVTATDVTVNLSLIIVWDGQYDKEYTLVGGLVGAAYNGTVTISGSSFTGWIDTNLSDDQIQNYGLVGGTAFFYANAKAPTVEIKGTSVNVNVQTYLEHDDYTLVGNVDENGKLAVTTLSIASATGMTYFSKLVSEGVDFSGAEVSLTQDVDLGGVTNWTPIGTSEHPFTGHFDGNGHKISNVQISGEKSNVGLFGVVAYKKGGAFQQDISISNFTLENVNIDVTGERAGAVVGSVNGNSGDSAKVAFSEITVTGTVIVKTTADYAGGFAGHLFNVTLSNIKVENVTDESKIQSTDTSEDWTGQAGGIAGHMSGVVANGLVSEIDVEGEWAGAIAGCFEVANITNATLSGNITGHSAYVGAVAGSISDGTNTVESVTFEGTVSTTDEGGLNLEEYCVIGKAYSAGATLTVRSSTVAITDIVTGYDQTTVWDESGNVTHTVEISSVEGLKYFAGLVNGGNSFEGVTVQLSNEIDLSNEAWTPIGTSANPFRGHFDGKGNTISNLQVTGTYAGLFGYVAGHAASIENLTVSGATLTEVIENKEAYAGAVVAKFQISTDQEAKLSNLHVVDVHITAYRYAGGIVGQSYVAITNCSAKNVTIDAKPNQTGDTYDNGDKVGGIAGWFVDDTSRELKNNRAENITLTAYRDVGGIAGYAGKAIVDGNFVKGVKITVDQITNNYGDDKETNAGYLYGRIKNEADWPKYVGTVEQGDGVEYSLTYNIKGSTALQSALNEASEYGSTTINLAEGTYEGTNNAKFGEKTITGFSIFADVRTASLSKDQYGNDKVYSRNIKNLTIQAMDNAEVTFTTAIVMHDGLDADADTHHTRLVSVDGVTVKGIKFDNASTPIFFINGYSGSKWSNITIENNTFTWDEAKTALNTDQIGVQMYSENFDVFKQGSEYRIFNVKVLNNTFTNAERPTYNCNISGFEFSGNTVNGYYFYAVSVNGTAIGGDVVVDGNTFYDPDNTTADNEGLIRGSILDGSLTFTNNKLYGITANKDTANGKQILISLQEGVNGRIYTSGNKWFAANTPEEAGDASGYSIVEMDEMLDTAKDSTLFRFYLELDEVEAKTLKTLSADMSTHPDYFEGFTTLTIVVNGEVDLGTEIVTINFGGSINFVGESEETSIINGMLAITAGGVTISNVTFRAETGTTEGNIILKVTAPTLDMTNCTVERTTGDAIAYGYILVATGDATLNNCTFIAPVKGSANEIHSVSPSVMEVKGQLTMNGGTISTNGYGLFSQHVTDATLTGVTFCGLERDYDGVTVKSLYMAINSIKINDITFSNCTIKDCRDWGMLLGGTTVTVEGCTFENSNADCGIVFYSPIANATIKGNTFNLQSGMDTIRFGKNSVLANTVLNIKNNTVNGGNEAVKFQVAAGETDLANVLGRINSDSTTINAPVTISLGEGTYSPNANEQFKIIVDNVTLVGAGKDEQGAYKTAIDAGEFTCSGQAGFEISGDNCSVTGIKFVTTSTDPNVAALKVTDLDTETAIVNGFSITDCEVVGNLGHALNLHGVDNVVVDKVKIGKNEKCGISLAKATNVLIKNTTFTDSECWADIGFMYKTGNAYITPCKVTVDFSTCTFAKNGIYSERPASADGGVDRIYDGAAIEGATEITAESGAPAGWTFANTASGWAMGKVEA